MEIMGRPNLVDGETRAVFVSDEVAKKQAMAADHD